MEVEEGKIPGLKIITPKIFSDQRGFFFEAYQKEKFAKNGIRCEFRQLNHSRSRRGVLRGLHFQKPPSAQAKLVRVVKGEVFDVAVDLRSDSATYGRWQAVNLAEDNHKLFFIPAGFAHGFLALSSEVEFCYLVDNFYDSAAEGGIHWSDPDLAISWPKRDYIVSDKDQQLPAFKDLEKIAWS